MTCLKHFRWVIVFLLAISTASAQDADTFSISGTFQMHYKYGTVGNDLAAAYTNDNVHGWTLTLYGVTYSHDSYSDLVLDEWGEYLYVENITRVHATSLDFEFFGPDADLLNQAVSQQLRTSDLANPAILGLQNSVYYDSIDFSVRGSYGNWELRLLPPDASAGVSFIVSALDQRLFSADENGYPLVEPQRLRAWNSAIRDRRPGNTGSLESANDFVDLGSDVPPLLPTSLNILDASVKEGNTGTTRMDVAVRRSGDYTLTHSVQYGTVAGTALASQDYTATTGTLTFLPGETTRVISIAIKTDRKREANETFTVRLSNAVGAHIEDGSGTATILNDD